MTLLQAIIIAIVEGITEFLPVSSTGHMIIAAKLLGIEPDAYSKAFILNIQFGAILSVLVLYWRRFMQSMNFYYKLFLGFLPAAIIGFLLNDWLDALLESVLTVAISFVAGGVVLLFIDKLLNPKEEKEITYGRALRIGLFQCIAMIPGVSRSAASIIGGMAQGLTRKQAAEFSFFLAVPTLAGAGLYKSYKAYKEVPQLYESDGITMLLAGNLVAFIVAMLAIKFFITYLTKHGFKVFGWYRIAVGLILLVLLACGVDLSLV
ncbi:MAG: undecaprenyl-diphosphate phosphatase [Flavobacteriales bacterium]